MCLVLFVLVSLIVETGLGYFEPISAFAADKTEVTIPAPDPDPKLVKPPRPGESFACDPLAAANVFDDRFTRRATIWTNYAASKVAIEVSGDGKRLLLMRESDVSAGVAQPEEFAITYLGNTSYLTAQEPLTLGLASIIFDVRTMKMVWSFNGQGMLGMKGETVLFQCR
jgi:hypothetical protein